MNITNNIVIDLQNSKRKHIAEVKQSDRSSRAFRFTVLNSNKPFDMSGVYTATVKGIKPDETIIYAAADIEKDGEGNNTNNIAYTMSDHVTSVSGTITFEIQLLSSKGEMITSFDFYVDVINQLYDEDDVISESDLNGFKAYLVRTLNATRYTESIEKSFEDAYGTVESIKADLEARIEECDSVLEDIQRMLDTGAFIGAKGPQGENGRDGVITEGSQVIGFQIEDDELICHYYGDGEPDISMNDDGCIEWNI